MDLVTIANLDPVHLDMQIGIAKGMRVEWYQGAPGPAYHHPTYGPTPLPCWATDLVVVLRGIENEVCKYKFSWSLQRTGDAYTFSVSDGNLAYPNDIKLTRFHGNSKALAAARAYLWVLTHEYNC